MLSHVLSGCIALPAGAHFDVWVADYYDYRPGRQDGSVFKPPASCKNKKVEPSEGLRSFPAQMMALAPAARLGECLQYRFPLEQEFLKQARSKMSSFGREYERVYTKKIHLGTSTATDRKSPQFQKGQGEKLFLQMLTL